MSGVFFSLLLLFFNTPIVRVPYSRSSVWWDFGGRRGSSSSSSSSTAKRCPVWFGLLEFVRAFFFFSLLSKKEKFVSSFCYSDGVEAARHKRPGILP